MGAGDSKVLCTENLDSLLLPGEKSVISGALDPYVPATRTFEVFMEEFERVVRQPPTAEQMALVAIKDWQETSDGPDGFFTVVKTYDEEKMDAVWNLPQGWPDLGYLVKSKWMVDYDDGLAREEVQRKEGTPAAGLLPLMVQHWQLHAEPLRLEFWVVYYSEDGTSRRKAGPKLREACQKVLDQVLFSIEEAGLLSA